MKDLNRGERAGWVENRSFQRRLGVSRDDWPVARQLILEEMRKSADFRVFQKYFSGFSQFQWRRFCYEVSAIQGQLNHELFHAIEIFARRMSDDDRTISRPWLERILRNKDVDSIPLFLFRRLKIEACDLPGFVANIEPFAELLDLHSLDLTWGGNSRLPDRSVSNNELLGLVCESLRELLSRQPGLRKFALSQGRNASYLESGAVFRQLIALLPKNTTKLNLNTVNTALIDEVLRQSWPELTHLELNALLFDNLSRLRFPERMIAQLQSLRIRATPYNAESILTQLGASPWPSLTDLSIPVHVDKRNKTRISSALSSFSALKSLWTVSLGPDISLAEVINPAELSNLSSLRVDCQRGELDLAQFAELDCAENLTEIYLVAPVRDASAACWSQFKRLKSISLVNAGSQSTNQRLKLSGLQQSDIADKVEFIEAWRGFLQFDLSPQGSSFAGLKRVFFRSEAIYGDAMKNLANAGFAPGLESFCCSFAGGFEWTADMFKPLRFLGNLQCLSLKGQLRSNKPDNGFLGDIVNCLNADSISELSLDGLHASSRDLRQFFANPIASNLSVIHLNLIQNDFSNIRVVDRMVETTQSFPFLESIFVYGLELRTLLAPEKINKVFPNMQYEWERRGTRPTRNVGLDLSQLIIE